MLVKSLSNALSPIADTVSQFILLIAERKPDPGFLTKTKHVAESAQHLLVVGEGMAKNGDHQVKQKIQNANQQSKDMI